PEQCYGAEIDVFEGLGGPSPHPDEGWAPTREVYYGTIHRNTPGIYGQPDNTNPNAAYPTGIDLTQDFHIYSALWTPDEVVWYLDERELMRYPAYLSLSQPMFILLDMWSGGWEWAISPY